jgi:hypothetical protein
MANRPKLSLFGNKAEQMSQASPAGRPVPATVTDGPDTPVAFDLFTRWLCEKCEKPGIDSWNKAAHDGLDFEGDYPNPIVWGDTCQCCGAPVVVAYTTPDAAPTAIFGAPGYSDENANMDRIGADPTVGITLLLSGP